MEHTILNHPWPYHYFYHEDHDSLESFQEILSFHNEMKSNCPHEKFLSGPRSSSLKFDSKAKLIQIPNHEICTLAKNGLDWGMQGTAHGNVQLWMMRHDPKTISIELPLWLSEDELSEYGFSYETKGSLSGHVDVLRIEDGKIWVWDFKPKAIKEKYADTQVLMYTLMLSHRTKIPLEKFMCGYFDEETSFVFKPEQKHYDELKKKIAKPRRKPIRKNKNKTIKKKISNNCTN